MNTSARGERGRAGARRGPARTLAPDMMVMRVCAMNFLRCSESWSPPSPRGRRIRTPLLLTAGLLRVDEEDAAATDCRLATNARVFFSCVWKGGGKWCVRKALVGVAGRWRGPHQAKESQRRRLAQHPSPLVYTFLKTEFTVRLISVESFLACKKRDRAACQHGRRR